jgi:lantibiotic modifying enzyme
MGIRLGEPHRDTLRGSTRQSLAQAASAIAREVHAQASYARDGGIYWTQPSAPRETPGRPRQLDSYLYPGAMGIALFFALAARVLRLSRYRSLALEAIAPLRRELAEVTGDPGGAAASRLPIGGLVGLGSLVYGLVRLGEVLRLPRLWQEAADLSSLITPGRIREDERFEVMTGGAGAILALLALASRRPEANRSGSAPLDLALTAGEQLVTNRRSWSRSGSRRGGADAPLPPPGFCHGTAGIVCALGRLGAQSGRADLARVAAEEWAGLAQEYDPGAGNWCLGDLGGVSAGLSWCNGAAGIVLAGLEVPSASACAGALAGGLGTLAGSPLGDKDHLCCGNMGRVDVLLRAASRTRDRALAAAAASLASRVMARAAAAGRYRLMFHPQEVADVRLFPGSTGVGYGLLRVIAPRSVPCVLALA